MCACSVTRLCPTLCNKDCSPPGSSVHGTSQARILECVAIFFSSWSSLPRYQTQVSCTASRLFTIWATREVLTSGWRKLVKSTGEHLSQFSSVQLFSHVWLFVTPWTVAHQAPLSVGFSRQEYWSVLPFSSTGDLLDPGIEPRLPTLHVDCLPSEPPGKPPKIYTLFLA